MFGFKKILAGGGVGLVNGLLGGGGGMIAVPALRGAGLSSKTAHATAIAVVLPASAASALVYLICGLLPFQTFLPVVIGTVLGGYLGARALKSASSRWVNLLFAGVMLAAGLKMVIGVRFLLLFLCGISGGVLGGMGMGGGTALIPLLTIVCGVEQSAAQAINLLAFAPMAALALFVHAKNGLLHKEGLLSLALPAVGFSVLGALLAAQLPSVVLSKTFGIFLCVLSVYWFKSAFKTAEKGRNI